MPENNPGIGMYRYALRPSLSVDTFIKNLAPAPFLLILNPAFV
jgi:hypothetical protein